MIVGKRKQLVVDVVWNAEVVCIPQRLERGLGDDECRFGTVCGRIQRRLDGYDGCDEEGLSGELREGFLESQWGRLTGRGPCQSLSRRMGRGEGNVDSIGGSVGCRGVNGRCWRMLFWGDYLLQSMA